MPDIEMRFDKDMLVISAPIDAVLERQGVDVERDLELFALLEPDTLHDALQLELMAGAQCLVATTRRMTPARLAHEGMRERLPELAAAALSIAASLTPQHLLVELEPCGLPFDASSKTSLNEHRDQYARAARAFEAAGAFDAYLLPGFGNAAEVKCALMGIRQASDCPVFASVSLSADGLLANGRDALEEAVAVMSEYGASVVGLRIAAGLDDACALAGRAAQSCGLPVLAELEVRASDACRPVPTAENPYCTPDAMVAAATRLRAAGVQFLRAVGAATPAYTGALAAISTGLDALPARSADAEDAAGVLLDATGEASGESAGR